MKVFIQYKNEKPIKFHFPTEMPIKTIKESIQNKMKIDSCDCRLSHRGTEMSDQKCLSNFRLQQSSVLVLQEKQKQILPQIITKSIDLTFQKLLNQYIQAANNILCYFQDRVQPNQKKSVLEIQKLVDDFQYKSTNLKTQLDNEERNNIISRRCVTQTSQMMKSYDISKIEVKQLSNY